MTGVFGDHVPGIPYRPIAELFAHYRDRDPAKTAIVDVDSGAAITFGELDRITNETARLLKSRGVGRGSRVLLLSDESLEKLLLWFGIWRLGAVVCPLNIEINEKVLADLVATVKPVLVLWHKDLDVDALVGGCQAPRIRFGAWSAADDPQDELFSRLSKCEAADLPERNQAEDLACIFCTSGTTSRPKIVVYDHCAYWLNGLSTLEFLGLTENDRTLEYRSFGWNSAQVLSLMPFLQKGLTMHIARRFSHSRFFEWIDRYGITFAAGVPTVLNMLLNKPPPRPPQKGESRTAEGSPGWGALHRGAGQSDLRAALTSPRSRGEVGICAAAAQIPGEGGSLQIQSGEPTLAERPPHPDPLPPSGEREHSARNPAPAPSRP
jgi:acyl-CoA synthetase (AMP-forming)/AMP-acid ligase II